jgi:hypothetical protein
VLKKTDRKNKKVFIRKSIFENYFSMYQYVKSCTKEENVAVFGEKCTKGRKKCH